MKQNGIWKFINAVIIMSILALVSSCVEQGSSNKRQSNSSSSTSGGSSNEPTTPDFSTSNNFFQEGSTQSTTGLTLPVSFNDKFYLRGEQVDYYIKSSNKTSNKCISFRFDSGVNTYLVAAAIPQFFYNFATNTQEYYYLISPGDKTKNQTFCQTPGVLATHSTINPLYNVVYSLAETCPTCSSGLFQSANTDLFSDSGNIISDVGVGQLKLNLSNTVSNPSNPNLLCTSSAECAPQGFDCCVQGQCVNDKSQIQGIDTTSSEFQAALIAVGLDPSLYSSYPQFFNLCPIDISPEPTVPVITDPNLTAAQRLERLTQLYECTTPQDGEVSYCTKTIENAFSQGPTFYTEVDDRNFNTFYAGTASIPNHSIHEIVYNDQYYYKDGAFIKNDITIGPSGDLSGNDTLTDPQQVNLNVGAASVIDTLKIKYKIDGSCVKVGTSLAKCDKYYVQGQNLGKATDHYPASQVFNLPYYSDANRTVSVTVDDAIVLNGSDWSLTSSSPSFITFSNNFQIFDTQKIKITFYVDLDSVPVLQTKLVAQQEIATMCECADLSCSLSPVYDDAKTYIKDYVCSYPQPDVPEAPLQQNVLLDSKTVPVRYFDQDAGLEHTDVSLDTPTQEGLPFSYTNNDFSKPNNVSSHVGFNEIYGSISGSAIGASAAKQVIVKKGKSYDIFVNSGTFSSCFYCGTDYFSNLAKIFPSNFIFKGGGYFPHPSQTDETTSEMRSHDLLYGRACFVPATMIPNSHTVDADRQVQRMNRQAAQHFYFANGYQRDWFGFDYGSVIGSFDGVKWFSIGNQRRITATTTRLFLAVNAYYADQSIDSTFSIDVNESSTTPNSGAFVTTDYESDGAECQKYHACDTDNDCAATLGWEYTCTSVASLQSAWPVFDQNAKEIPGQNTFLRLISMNGTTSGPSKRCVYRGRGAACLPDISSDFSATDSYNKTNDKKLFTCSANTYCQPFNEITKPAKFNTKISRYAKSIKTLIANGTLTEDDEDTFGYSAKSLGRPYNYDGTDEIPNDVLTAFSTSVSDMKVDAICIPGKEATGASYTTLNARDPGAPNADKVNGIGVTDSGVGPSLYYLSSCPVMDESGNYIHNTQTSITNGVSTTDAETYHLAATQNVSTNLLQVMDSQIDILADFEFEYVSTKKLQANRCLRAPGASCFSNFECAANPYIASKARSISSIGSIQNFEMEFWQRPLVCSQEVSKSDPEYDPRNNRCCRELGNVISIKNEVKGDNTTPDNSSIPGVDIGISDSRRYTAIAPAHYKMYKDSTTYPAIVVNEINAAADPISTLLKQYNTINTIAENTCCSKNWVRNFNDGTNNWDPTKLQSVDVTKFQCLNWVPGGSTTTFTCPNADGEGPDHPDCFMRSIPESEANLTLEWLSKFELTGIPQVAIEEARKCMVNPTNRSQDGSAIDIAGYFNPAANPEYNKAAVDYFSAADVEIAGADILKKKVFSEDEFTCCQPVGTQMLATDDPTMCCSGYINPDNNQCALKNYTNLSVYFNRYVSSEAKDLAPALIDEETGYIKSRVTVQQLACTKRACASGYVGYGIAHTDLKVPGHEANDMQVKRFIDGNDQSNNFNGKVDIFNEGLHWNTQVYCIPPELAQASGDVLQVFDCGQN
ncbi:hypothetical protein [Halobacteriovorax sp. HLS]|uniref:hypothetical protein n=1 Tax=Halobacteriovorax sp. HLS TaxID=2234000 RepID=UPI000FD8C339|nr:hypothetical protein [Halobacteriovorax sp. HLS]